jgi:hypothetical protein
VIALTLLKSRKLEACCRYSITIIVLELAALAACFAVARTS